MLYSYPSATCKSCFPVLFPEEMVTTYHSYIPGYHLCGALLLCGGSLMFALPSLEGKSCASRKASTSDINHSEGGKETDEKEALKHGANHSEPAASKDEHV